MVQNGPFGFDGNFYLEGSLKMPRRGENIRKRADGRWEGRVKTGRRPDGSIKYRSMYAASYREVKEKMRNAMSEIKPSISAQASDTSFEEAVKRWLRANDLRLKGGTKSRYAFLIEKHILPELGRVELKNISHETLRDFSERKLLSGLSPAYVRSMLSVITAVINFAVKNNLCAVSVKIDKPKLEKKSPRLLTVWEQRTLEVKLLSDLNETALGVLLALNSGLRVGELCALSWENVDLFNGIIKVRSTVARVSLSGGSFQVLDAPKTRSSVRDIPIANRLFPILAEAEKRAQSEYVVSTEKGFVSPRTFEYRYHRLMQRCGAPDINFHALRHTFATRCIEAGVDVKALSEMLGHSSVSVTMDIYVHPSLESKREQIEKMSRAVAL